MATNRFVWEGSTLVTTPAALVDPWAPRSLGTFAVSAGVLDFAFCTSGGDGADRFYPASCLSNADEDSFGPMDLQSIGTGAGDARPPRRRAARRRRAPGATSPVT